MLRTCVINFKGNWDDHLALIDFAYDNSYHSRIQMAPYKALYERRCRSLIGWFEEKLSPRYIGPYKISKRIGNVAYELELPLELAAVHSVFHISMLKKYMGDPLLIIPTENIGIKDNISYEEIPVEILDRQFRKLRT
ncbi:hypothetical protein MTR67_040334 [Solanum verrucosum]|uniref:Tf2-1-like SH3-like domain-containing protein n=1 Tax=Solanum verrucosum TaxID=315347 RepID=A0AAF0UKL0_SOLVR|nr:hypothetical protein MTR67_040334 [Solanum verrucosum]